MNRMIFCMGTLAFVALVVPATAAQVQVATRCQYVFINRAPWYKARDGVHWDQRNPDSFTREGFDRAVDRVGTRGGTRRKLGLTFILSLLQDDADTLARSTTALLAAAQASGVPVLIGLDGQNWWSERPDLWNWWDPGAPGYAPENRFSVEWFGWGPQFAVRGGWRNWGSQRRVAPAPNLADPRFRAEHVLKYEVLIPIIRRWYEALPADQRYLFGGVKVGWEACPHINAYYLKGGNSLLEQFPDDPSHDPQTTDREAGISLGQSSIGYAAATTLGLSHAGEISRDDLATVTADYLTFLARTACDLGLSRDQVFTHQGGNLPPWDKHLPFWPAINAWSVPGWSFYDADPPDVVGLGQALDAAGRRDWCAAEWWRPGNSEAEWEQRFRAALAYRDCRFVALFNWDCGTHFIDNRDGLSALRHILEDDQ